MNIQQKIRAYYGSVAPDGHHRYLSWEHCYRFFRRVQRGATAEQTDMAALHLGFYLASWGMYRGSSFLLQNDYTVHRSVVSRLFATEFARLWEVDFGSEPGHLELVPTVMAATEAVRDAYSELGQASDTLISKVLLGTLGCLPACDRYFIAGWKAHGLKYTRLDAGFVRDVFQLGRENAPALREEQSIIADVSKVHYPLMKLIDMFFWQSAYEDEKMPSIAE